MTLRRERRALFGGRAELIVPGSAAASPAADRALAQAWAQLARLDREWNAWKPGALHRVNTALAAGRRVSVDDDLARLLRQARDIEQASAGACNVAIGAAVAAWGFHADRLREGAAAPAEAALQRLREPVPTLASLHWQGGRLGGMLGGTDRRVRIDLGAIGKGHAADLALHTLRAAGIGSALVDLGGNLAAMCGPDGAGGRPWRIGIRHPDPAGGVVAAVELGEREAVITSAQSERRRRLSDGREVGHVLDARTLLPVSSAAGVTVLARDATWADAMATALLAADPAEPWPTVTARLGVAQALRVQPDGRIESTPALAARLRPA
ncbi:FAD:protein FMN transferase [Leptothrix discophora]|uniref:FAD:protein FMN transferase n=1 Tax=Leptothrix discophora TaxID=89 RepID=A0ABT9FY29_LEPDI|nr:FAD:protein FMN transferase [Leptothrix discophora]MDP4299123.1 FAD:protein FMN transferase [Leptothrix discophora]